VSKESGGYPRGPFAVGLVGTAIIAFLIAGFLSSGCIGVDCKTNLAALSTAEPNAVGDTLAGLAGALALFWIVITAWHQSVELREQREIIEDQKKEIAEQTVATKKMADALQAQADIFKLEQIYREQKITDEQISEIEKKLSNDIFSFSVDNPSWEFDFYIVNTPNAGRFEKHLIERERAKYVANSFSGSLQEIENSYEIICRNIERATRKPSFPSSMQEMIETVDAIAVKLDQSSEANRIRLKNGSVYKLREVFCSMKENKELWAFEDDE